MLKYELTKGILNISLDGELDHFKSKDIRNEMDTLILYQNYDCVVLDLSGLGFMDSTGIGLILGRHRLIKNRCKLFMIKNPSKGVDKVLKVSGIYTIIPKMEG